MRISIGKALPSCSINSAKFNKTWTISGGIAGDKKAVSSALTNHSWYCTESAPQHEINAALNNSLASGSYLVAQALQLRNAGWGDSLNNSAENLLSHSYQSSRVDLCDAAHALRSVCWLISNFRGLFAYSNGRSSKAREFGEGGKTPLR